MEGDHSCVRMSGKLWSVWSFEEPSENPQFRETISIVIYVRQASLNLDPDKTLKNSQWRETIQV